MKNLTSSFSISQKPKPDDLIVSINSRKEILFDKKTKNFFHKVPDQLPSQIFKIFEDSKRTKITFEDSLMKNVNSKDSFYEAITLLSN